MALNVNVNIVVPDLPDNDIWWANAAAWKNYWANIELEAEFPGYDNALYNDSPFDNTLLPINFNYNEVDYQVPSYAQFQSLLTDYQALKNSYKQLRIDLKNAGIILNTP